MKRDFSLIKKILLKIEEGNNLNTSFVQIDKHPKDEILNHIELLFEAKFIRGDRVDGVSNKYWTSVNLTWDGHEFLDLIRDDKAVSNLFDVFKGHFIETAPYEFIKLCLNEQLKEKVIAPRKNNY